MTTVVDLLITIGTFAVVFGVGSLLLVGRLVRRARDRDLMHRMSSPRGGGGDEIIRSTRYRTKEHGVFTFLYRTSLAERFETQMWQAGIYAPVADVLLISLLLFLLGLLAGLTWWADPLLTMATGAGLAVLPFAYIRYRSKRRLKAFSLQLPFALDLFKSSLEAGHSLLRGCQVVVDEFADPIGNEFRSVVEQVRLGLPLPLAFEEMLNRMPEQDLRLLVVAVKVQSEVGSSLAQIIGRLSEIVRTRQRLHQQVRALTAQSRMSGIIVGFLPVLMLAAFSVIQPVYVHTLFYDPTGVMILKGAALLDLMGLVTIRRLLKVRF